MQTADKQTSSVSLHLDQLQKKSIPYVIAGHEKVDLWQAMKKLNTKLQITKIAALGGGKMNGALLRAGLVDELSLIVVPLVVAGEDTPSSFEAVELQGEGELPWLLRLQTSKVLDDGTVWLKYVVLEKLGDEDLRN